MDISRRGIYRILNLANQKVYIGKTSKTFAKRWSDHISCLKLNKHECYELQDDWNLYGSKNFMFEVVEYIDDKEILQHSENYWIHKFFYNSYNSIKGKKK